MIDNIFGNKTNVLVLRFLTRFANEFYPATEISEETGAGLRNVHDSLKMLSYAGVLSKRLSNGKIYYKFVADTIFNAFIHDIFSEERKRLFLQRTKLHKVLYEIEANTIKVFGENLVDVILFGSAAKGRDTAGSDIDICVIVNKKDPKKEERIRRISFENEREIQLHIFTSKDFLEATRSRNPLVESILRDGLSLKTAK